MDYLQYFKEYAIDFKTVEVLNLVINGLPSILLIDHTARPKLKRFKPCYKWITFNTLYEENRV